MVAKQQKIVVRNAFFMSKTLSSEATRKCVCNIIIRDFIEIHSISVLVNISLSGQYRYRTLVVANYYRCRYQPRKINIGRSLVQTMLKIEFRLLSSEQTWWMLLLHHNGLSSKEKSTKRRKREKKSEGELKKCKSEIENKTSEWLSLLDVRLYARIGSPRG